MTQPTEAQADIVERLTAMYSHRGDGLPTQYVNPDGLEAATEITRLRAQLAEAELRGVKAGLEAGAFQTASKYADLVRTRRRMGQFIPAR